MIILEKNYPTNLKYVHRVIDLRAQMQTLRGKMDDMRSCIKLVTSDQTSRAGAEDGGRSSYECLKAQKLEMEKKLEAEKLRKEQLEETLRLSNLEKKLDQLNIVQENLPEVGLKAGSAGLPEVAGDTKTVNEIPINSRERVSQLREYKNALLPEKKSIGDKQQDLQKRNIEHGAGESQYKNNMVNNNKHSNFII